MITSPFHQNLENNCKNLEPMLLQYGFNFNNIIELEPFENCTSRRIHQFWMHKIKIIDSKTYLHVGRHAVCGIIFRDTINNLYYVNKDLIKTWKNIIS